MSRKQRTSTPKTASETIKDAAKAPALWPVLDATAAAVELLFVVEFRDMLREGDGE